MPKRKPFSQLDLGMCKIDTFNLVTNIKGLLLAAYYRLLQVFVRPKGGSLGGSGGLYPGGLCPPVGGGVSVQEEAVRETPRTVMCGRYTSYWNAFLYFLHIVVVPDLYSFLLTSCVPRHKKNERRHLSMQWAV